MPPIIFLLSEVRCIRNPGQGVGPSFVGRIPLPAPYYVISGITKDLTGAVLPSCIVNLFRALDNVLVDSVVSGSDGSYQFRSPGPAENYYTVAYLAGAPDVAGTTVNTLVGTGT